MRDGTANGVNDVVRDESEACGLTRGEKQVMLKTGKEHVEPLRDGRVVYLGSERIDDVTTHPAFRHAVRTVAMLYDMIADSAQRETMTYDENGCRHCMCYSP